MSKQKRGLFRIIAGVMAALGVSQTHHYDDTVFGSPENKRRKKRAHGHVSRGRWRNTRETVRMAPSCVPGTITYHDKLVRHFGRRRAEGYRIAIQRGHLNCLPTADDFRNNPPWGFVKPHL